MELEEGDVVLCTVDRIVNTVVFVKIDETDKEGSIILSEIAPGRIRNLRDYVVPKKKIVCKILKIDPSGNIHLSLRRVTPKEQKEVKERYKQEKSYEKIFKTILGEKEAEKILSKIKEQETLYDFVQEIKEIPKKLEKLIGKENAKRILEILKNQKQKKVVIKETIFLTTPAPNGIELIKKTLLDTKKEAGEIEISYLSAGKYLLKLEGENPKKTSQRMRETLLQIEKRAKANNVNFKTLETK